MIIILKITFTLNIPWITGEPAGTIISIEQHTQREVNQWVKHHKKHCGLDVISITGEATDTLKDS